MADNEKEIKLRLTAEDNVTSAIKKVATALGKTELGQSVTAASTAFLALKSAAEVVGSAIDKVTGAIAKTVDAAAQAEVADKRLATSLITTGHYTEDNFRKFNQLATAIQNATGTSDEAVKDLATLGLSLGLTADQAETATKAALDLAAATGQSAEMAMRQLSLTINGTAGKLGLMIPEVKGLTQAQLQNGEAIDIVSKKYAGFANASSTTFAGAQAKAHEAFGDMLESLGSFITKSPAVLAALDAAAKTFSSWAESIADAQKWLAQNSDTIESYAKALGIAVVVVGTYLAVMNAAKIATTAWTVAQIALNSAMALNPVGAAVLAIGALTVAIGYAIDHFEQISGAIKIGLGYALEAVSAQLQAFLTVLSKTVGIFNKEWAQAIQGVNDKITGYATGLKEAGRAQIAAAEAAKNHANGTKAVASEIKGLETQAQAAEQAMIRMTNEFSRFRENAKAAMDGVKDFAPRLALDDWNEKSAGFQSSLEKLKKSAADVVVKLSATIGPLDPAQAALLKQAKEEEARADAGLAALAMKNAQMVRDAKIKEADIANQQIYIRAITAQNEIYLKAVAAEEALRQKKIELATQRIIDEEGIERHGIDIKTQAQLNAQATELASFQEHLNAKMQLAVSMETQQALAVAAAKNAALAGLGGSTEGAAKADETVAKEQARQAQLQVLRDQDLLSEQQYQQALLASRTMALDATLQLEQQKHEERAQALGLSPDAVAASLAAEQAANDMKLANLQLMHDQERLSDAEFKTALEQAELDHQARIQGIKEDNLSKEVDRNKRMNDNWGATLANIRLQQEKEGKLLGAIKAVQQSEQFKGLQGALADTASLMSSGNREAFAVGKAAAIAQATINTFMSATAAYASLAAIPIVGPALGAVAAAAAVAAGIANVAKIKSQTFQPPKGGQADQGIDSVPESLSGRSFILSAGERVVQPEANQELMKATDKINNGSAGQNFTFHITMSGNPSEQDKEALKAVIIDAVREATERGQPVVNSKGIVSA